MKKIDIENWNRKKHFLYYKEFDNPCFSVNFDIEITSIINFVKEKQTKFFPTFIFALFRALNKFDEFKFRIRGEQVVCHELIHPSFTVLNKNGSYYFCDALFMEDFDQFYPAILAEIEKASLKENLEDEPNKDDLVFISSISWFSFTGLTHPFTKNDPHSVPRITFGKYYLKEDKYFLPFSIQVHHGLCDGYHIALLKEELEKDFSLKI
ncbi:MAG: chloramphenicol acetyltransferase [Candidatus Izemoplasmatales bacterium]